MNLKTLLDKLQVTIVCDPSDPEAKVTGAYCSDLLSHVMANAESGNLWLTIQNHPNIVAVASLVGMPAIVLTCGVTPDQDTLSKAQKEKVAILTTTLSTYEIGGQIYRLISLEA